MARPWETLGRAATPDGELTLRRRGERDFLLLQDGRVLMNSAAHASEKALAELALEALPSGRDPSVMLGGLGLGLTLRSALDRLPSEARICVAELHPAVVDWCRGPLAACNGAAVSDPRVESAIGDAFEVLQVRGGFDAVLLDLFSGPRRPVRSHPLWGDAACARAHAALRPGGIYAVWSEVPDPVFETRLRRIGFEVRCARAGRGGRRHAVVLARRPEGEAPVRGSDSPGGRRRGPARRSRSSEA